MENTKQKDSWVVEVEESLKGEIRADESPDGLIHKVPESFLSENTKVFYHPQVISLGPYHFEKKEKLDDEIELLKSDVAKKVHHEIIGALNSSENVGSPDLPEIPEEKEKKRKRYHPLLTEIVKDMLKMENQLPFWALKEIRPDIEDWTTYPLNGRYGNMFQL
ncbi:hypothetical protein SUGI_0181020 [Cryptomeria japonica]|nr:hypothetical protein SUGI_0181020 [Cryptomeria japonica]